MGRTNEFTLVADANFSGKLGYAVVVKAELDHNTPVGTIAGAGVAIDGIISDITGPALAGSPVAVARIGDITFASLGGAVTVGDELATDANGQLVKAGESAVVVGKALATGVKDELIPVLLK